MVALPANHLRSISRPLSAPSRFALLTWLACLLLTLLVPAALRADTYTLPGTNITLTYTVSGTTATATITDCNVGATGALIIPDTLGGASVTSIGDGAFSDCSSLTSATIPSSITSIGAWAFLRCTGLTAFNADPANPAYASSRGVLFDKSFRTLIQAPGALSGHYTIPSSCESSGGCPVG